jgi:poly(A) polymerase
MPEVLHKMAPEGAIEDLTPKPEAYTPIITLKYSGIDIDLLYGRVASASQIPKDMSMLDMNLLRGLTDPEVRCLNGVRTADEILNLVPQAAVFRVALRVIKLWASRRAITGNIFGFPGGVAWAILVARICQLYPKATSSTVVSKFFLISDRWAWPTPVMLKNVEAGTLGLRTWNPQVIYFLSISDLMFTSRADLWFRQIPYHAHNHPRVSLCLYDA